MEEQAISEDGLRRQIEAYHTSALVYAAVKLALPDRMESRAWTAEQLAQEMGLSPPHLFRFLRALVTLGICEERPQGSFALASLGQSLRSGAPFRLREKVMIVVEQYWQPWANLVHSLQTGSTAFEHVFGMPVWEWRGLHADQGVMFNAYLAHETLAEADAIVDAFDFANVGVVADIGGGFGGLLAAILRAHPGLAGILFDAPQTVEAAEPLLRSLGVAERVQFVSGDFFARVPVQADLYLLKSVLHHWDDAQALAILKNCRQAMPPSAKLLIIERLLPERAMEDVSAVMIDLHMMVITGGRARSLEEMEQLLARARLALSKVIASRSGLSMVEAVSR